MSRPFSDFVHPHEREHVVALALEARPADSDLLTLENRFRARGGRWERVRWHPVLEYVPSRTAKPRAGRAMVACLALASLLVVAGLVFGLPAGTDTGRTTPVGQLPASLHGPVDRYGPLVPSSRDWQAPPGSVGRPLTSRG